MSSSSFFSESGSGNHAYSRKQKSLGLLCSNFLKLYNRDDVESVGLDEAAKRLGVERRRIYDIVNVLESVGVLSRKAKNRYSWKGFDGIPNALKELKEQAAGENFYRLLGNSCSHTKISEADQDEKLFSGRGDQIREDDSSTSRDLSKDTSLMYLCFKKQIDNRREKSLGLLTQNFVKLFLSSDADVVSLDDAARLLLGNAPSSSKMRNNSAAKVRRLYDIANVLSSINLIEKTHQTETRKPAFRWLGFKMKPVIDSMHSDRSLNLTLPTEREFGMDITNTDTKRTKVTSSSTSKTIQAPDKCEQETQEDLIQRTCPKGYVYGPFRPLGLTEGRDTDRFAKRAQDWEALSSMFCPQYNNRALSELFAHYKEAWKSWNDEAAQGNKHQRCKVIH